MKTIMILMAGLFGLVLAPQTHAATIDVVLTNVTGYYPSSVTRNTDLSASTATFQYDDVTGVLTQTGGTYEATFLLPPAATLYTHLATGFVLGNGAAASATTYWCLNGSFFINAEIDACAFQPLGIFDGFDTQSWDGTTLVIGNYPCPEGLTCETTFAQLWTLEAQVPPIPLPAAAWLFGGALAALAWLRSRRT